MVTYKLVLDERRAKQDQTFPLVIRVTFNRRVTSFQTGVYLIKELWDAKHLKVRKTHPNALALTTKAIDHYTLIQKSILSLESQSKFSIETLKHLLDPSMGGSNLQTTFKMFADSIIKDMIAAKRAGGALIYQTAINRLIAYADDPDILFSQIDYTFLDKFKNSLIEQGLKTNSIGNYFRSIRALYNKAIKAKLVSRDLYPFHDVSIKTEKTAKRAISVESLAKVYRYTTEPYSQSWHAVNYFFLSFTFRGMSFTDMAYLKPVNIQGDYLTYRRRKTGKLYTIKVHPIAKSILQLYTTSNTTYLLPVFITDVEEDSITTKKITRQWIKTTNKYLNVVAGSCNVQSNLTTYVIRHTWATIAKLLRYTNEMIAEALGHEYGNKITNIYLDNFEQDVIDKMNAKVIGEICEPDKQLVNQWSIDLLNYN
jgi:integrase